MDDDTSAPLDPPAGPDAPAPQHAPIDSRAETDAAIDRLLPRATRTLSVFDLTLGTAWDRGVRVEALRAFCLASRRNRVRIVVHDAQPLLRHCPRLVGLTRQFAHVLAIHETHDTVKSAADPLVLVDELHYVHRFHHTAPHGLAATDDPLGARPLSERFEELWAASDPAITGTTLGL
jgi:hypothetical protein